MPSAGTPIGRDALFSGVRGLSARYDEHIKSFNHALAAAMGVKSVFTVSSGTAAVYVALEAFKRIRPEKKKIIIPAYTAPIIKLPIEKAGLEVVLCEISKETFNMDLSKLSELLSDDVLCVMPTHLFGIPTDIIRVKEIIGNKEIFILEDAAQSIGSTIDGRQAGSLGDIGIVSFNRGKNLSTFSGGAMLTNSEPLSRSCESVINELPDSTCSQNLAAMIKLIIVSQVVKPSIYSIVHSFLEPFKSRTMINDFIVSAYTGVQAAAGLKLLGHLDKYSEARHRNGVMLAAGLKGVAGVTLQTVRTGIKPAFNQFPMVVDDTGKIQKITSRLWDAGIETTRLYLKPMHKIFGLGYHEDAFPAASWLAEGLILVPTHPYVRDEHILRTIKILCEELK